MDPISTTAIDRRGFMSVALQASRWQEHRAADAGGPRAQQAGKLETRALFAGSQGGTVARAGGNTCTPLSVRLDLGPPIAPRPGLKSIEAVKIRRSGRASRCGA